MTKKEYLYELYQEKLIDRVDVDESQKSDSDVVKVTIQGKTNTTSKYVKYVNGELTDDEIDRIIQLRQSKSLRNISGILTFFLVVGIIGVIAMIAPYIH